MSKFLLLGFIQVGVALNTNRVMLNISEVKVEKDGIIYFDRIDQVELLIDHLQKAVAKVKERTRPVLIS